jgi:HEAT repeat protein
VSAPARALVATLLAAAALTTRAAAQGRFTNAKTETRAAAQGLDREVRAIAARPGPTWIGYRAPVVAGPRRMCCYDGPAIDGQMSAGDPTPCCGLCRLERGSGVTMSTGDSQTADSRIVLEPPTEFLVLARVEHGEVGRVRTFTPDCDVDAGGMPLVWLTDVRPEDSIAWLASLVGSAPDAGERRARVAKPALAAIALHDRAAADSTLESFVAPARPDWLRGDTAFWLGSARGEPGARLLARMIADDPSDSVRDKAAFGLSVSQAPSALATLIAAAKNDRSPHVRGRALFWLAHQAGRQAVAAIANAIDADPETEVKKKAVFALSQLPKDEGIPKLIEVARTNKNPEVRKQAFFWLGQSRDPRAAAFFEEVLLKKP